MFSSLSKQKTAMFIITVNVPKIGTPYYNGICPRDATVRFNSIALRMAKTPYSFGHSECNRVNNTGIHPNNEWQSVDLDQNALDMVLHFLLRPICPNTLGFHGKVNGYNSLFFFLPFFTKGNNFESTCLLPWIKKLLQRRG